MKLLNRFARLIRNALAFVALASPPVGTYYAYLTYLDAVENETRQREINAATLGALKDLLPPAEGTRLGIDKLIELTRKSLEDRRREQPRRSAESKSGGDKPSAPAVAGWQRIERELSLKAEQIWPGIRTR
jgi:hypothetical protein